MANQKVGRPTKYKPEFCDLVIDLMSQGRSLDGCAPIMGVHPDSLYQWQHDYPEFSDAVRIGRAHATQFWEDRLIKVADGLPGNANSIMWALKNRSRAAAGWHHDVQKQELSGPDGGAIKVDAMTINVGDLTPDQRDALRSLMVAAKAGR
jgi:transposase